MRLAEVWSGETILLRTERGGAAADPPFTLGWLFRMVTQERRSLKDLFVASLALSFLTIVPPLLVMSVVDKVITHHSFSTLFLISVILTIMVAYETLLGFARRLIIAVVGVRTDAKLNLHVFARLIRLPLDYFERHPAGETMYKISQIHQVRNFITGKLMTTLLDMITLAVLLPFLFWLNPTLAWIVLVCSAAVLLIILAYLRPMRVVYGKRHRRRNRQAVRPGRDHLRHQDREVPGAGAAAQGAVGRARGRGRQVAPRLQQAVQLAADPGHADRAVHVDGHRHGRRLPRAGRRDRVPGRQSLFAFMMLSQRVSQPLVGLARLIEEWEEVGGAMAQAADALNRPLEVDAASGGLRPKFSGAISFEDVTFTYAGTKVPALEKVAFSIPAGTMLGLVGRSGSGKSTVTRLLQGINREYSGFVKIDGSDLREINLRHLRSSFGTVLQENFLFRGSIRDNILAGRPGLTLEDAIRAARLAGAEEFIERMPNGYDTYIEEGSPNLSGGQRSVSPSPAR